MKHTFLENMFLTHWAVFIDLKDVAALQSVWFPLHSNVNFQY